MSNPRLAALIISLGLSGCARDPAVATVNQQALRLNAYRQGYQGFLQATNLPDNLNFRHLFLQSLIDEQLLLNLARERDYLAETEHLQALQKIADQLVLDSLYISRVRDRTPLDDHDLRRLYRWSNTKLHLRHLFARDHSTLESIQNRLQNGTPWENLARRYFQDPVLSANGGDLGWVALGDLDPAFEAVAFSLDINEISPPVKTRYGYSIIQVLEMELNPFLIEDDYQIRKNKLKKVALSHKRMPALRSYTDQVGKSLNMRFQEPGLDLVWSTIPTLQAGERETPLDRPEADCLLFGPADSSWSVNTALRHLATLSERQLRKINSKDNLRSVLKGLLIRRELLQTARELNLNPGEAYLATERKYLIAQVLETAASQEGSLARAGKLSPGQYHSLVNSLRKKALIVIDSALVKNFESRSPG